MYFVDQIYSGGQDVPSSIGIDGSDGVKFWIPVVDDDLKPVVGKVYESLEKGIEMYKKYAAKAGFDVRLSSVKRNAYSMIVLRYIVCNRAGFPDSVQADTLDGSNKKIISTNIHRTGCEACVKFKALPAARSFRLYAFEEKHNVTPRISNI